MDRELVPHWLNYPDRWSVVHLGQRRVAEVGGVTPDRISVAVMGAPHATSWPDGAYFIPPPYEAVTPEGWPVMGIRAFPTVVI